LKGKENFFKPITLSTLSARPERGRNLTLNKCCFAVAILDLVLKRYESRFPMADDTFTEEIISRQCDHTISVKKKVVKGLFFKIYTIDIHFLIAEILSADSPSSDEYCTFSS